MELTRRDAVCALAAASAGSLAGCTALRSSGETTGTTENGVSTGDADRTKGSGVTSGGTGTDAGTADTPGSDAPIDEHESATLIALAEVVYPTAIDGIGEFVRTYVGGRLDGDEADARGVAEAIDTLDEYAREFHDAAYAELSRETRRETIDHMSVDAADPVADGTAAERVRHYLVNELLYALYTSPTGANLAGLENPPGHPGGIRSYREGPQE